MDLSLDGKRALVCGASRGFSLEGGFEAMRFFTEPKNVCVRYG